MASKESDAAQTGAVIYLTFKVTLSPVSAAVTRDQGYGELKQKGLEDVWLSGVFCKLCHEGHISKSEHRKTVQRNMDGS